MENFYDSHMHTTLCKHAVGSPSEYAASALQKKLKGITFTCHNPVPDWSPGVRMSIEEYPIYIDMIKAVQEEYAGQLEIYLGLESDYIPGMESWLEKLHARQPLSYILGSVHSHLSDYRKRFFHDNIREFQELYFDHLVSAAKTGLFNALAHPDLVKNCYPDSWNYLELRDHVCRCLDQIAKTDTAMELNTSGVNKRVKEFNPGASMLSDMAARSIPVVLGSDSHVPERVGADFAAACEVLRNSGYSEVSYFINGERKQISIVDCKAAA